MRGDPSTFGNAVRRLNPDLDPHFTDVLKPLTAGPMAEKEAELHDAIIAECRANGWYYVHSRMDKRATVAVGTPDFIVFMPARIPTMDETDAQQVVCIECKTKTGKQTKEQQATEAHLRKLGHKYYVVRSIEQFREAIQQTN